MSFTTTIMHPDVGVWQSSDMRVTVEGALLDDMCAKTVSIDGSNGWMLLTFAGWGRVRPENVNISSWLAEVLCGGAYRTIDEYTIAIERHANEDLASRLAAANAHHAFVMAVYREGVPYLCQIRNFAIRNWKPVGSALPRFKVKIFKVDTPIVVTWPPFESDADRALLANLSVDPPANHGQAFETIAAINLRVAQSAPYRHLVSPHCLITYRPYTGDGFSEFRNFPAGAVGPVLAVLGGGLDSTHLFRLMRDEFSELCAGIAVRDRDLHGAIEKGLTPQNRLSKQRNRDPRGKLG
jgi:hypothetical protein